MSDWIQIIGWITAVAGGFALAAAALALAAWLTGVIGKTVFMRITRIYSLTVVWYWLNRLEKEGTHCFPKASKDKP